MLIFLISVLPFAGYAQDITSETLSWKAISATNAVDGSSVNYSGDFVSNGNTSVDWIQSGGKMTSHYTVTSVDGQWSNCSTDGQIIYNVQINGLNGSITFKRSNGQLTIRLQVDLSDQPDFNYLFTVSNVNRQ